MSRLLHCTDFHFKKPWFEWLSGKAPDFDVICVTGDFLDLDVHLRTQPKNQICWISDWVAEFPATPLFLCSGNHDLIEGYDFCPWLEKLKRPGVSVDGDVVTIGTSRIESVTWYGNPKASPPADIALSHSPPSRTITAISQAENRDFGDPALFDFLNGKADSPRIILCGHIHSPRRWHDRIARTQVFNPGVNHMDPWPAHVELDLVRRTAVRRAFNQPDDLVSLL